MVPADTGERGLTGARYDVDTIALLGGHIALDFVNTIEDRISDEPEDTLRTPDDLRRWGIRLGVLDATTSVTPPELERAIAVRGHLLALFETLVSAQPLPSRDVNAVAEAVAQAHAAGRLTPSPHKPLAWSWDPSDPATVRHHVATAALDLLSSATAARRLERCANDDCGWFFLDTTRNASRRWCSMSGCGNRAKNRRRRDR
jgi:predicted RNA-binding Zn ribbon-like protein